MSQLMVRAEQRSIDAKFLHSAYMEAGKQKAQPCGLG